MSSYATYKRCKFCKVRFTAMPSVIKKRKYCSQTCSNRANGPKLSHDRMGSKNYNYTGIEWAKRGSKRYNNFRYKVFARDNDTCQICNEHLIGSQRICHHIKPWSTHEKLRYVVSNGMTICRSCHNKIDDGIKSSQYVVGHK